MSAARVSAKRPRMTGNEKSGSSARGDEGPSEVLDEATSGGGVIDGAGFGATAAAGGGCGVASAAAEAADDRRRRERPRRPCGGAIVGLGGADTAAASGVTRARGRAGSAKAAEAPSETISAERMSEFVGLILMSIIVIAVWVVWEPSQSWRMAASPSRARATSSNAITKP